MKSARAIGPRCTVAGMRGLRWPQGWEGKESSTGLELDMKWSLKLVILRSLGGINSLKKPQKPKKSLGR